MSANPATPGRRARPRAGFLERNVAALAEALDHAAFADEITRRAGLLQGIDPRVKIVGIFLLILVAAGTRRLAVVGAMFAVGTLLAVASRIPWRELAVRAWLGVLAFTGLIALPAIFLTPGEPLAQVPILHWTITAPGVLAAARLVARAETTATLALALVLTTPWTHLLKALRVLHVPRVAVVILGMTHRYIFLLLGLARDYFEARRSRQVGTLDAPRRRQVAAATAGVLLGRSLDLSGEVFLAMQSRGFRGEVHLLDSFRLRRRDGFALAGFIAAAALAFWWGTG